MKFFERLVYEFRWWRWFLRDPFSNPWAAPNLDIHTRRIILRRWLDSEPAFRGTFPHRVLENKIEP